MLALWRTSRLCGGPRSHGSCSAQPGPARPGPARPRWVAGCANGRASSPGPAPPGPAGSPAVPIDERTGRNQCWGVLPPSNGATSRLIGAATVPLGPWAMVPSLVGTQGVPRPGGGGPRNARVEADRGTPGAPVRRPPPRPPRRPPARCDARRGPATTAPTFAASGCACYHPPVIDGRHHVNVVFGGTSAASAG
jgi:hypothetical protein